MIVKLLAEHHSEFLSLKGGCRECSGSVVESLTRDRGAVCSSLTSVRSLSKNINPSLVLVQPRKTRPFITERLLMGRKISNKTKTKGGCRSSSEATLVKMSTYRNLMPRLNYINAIFDARAKEVLF